MNPNQIFTPRFRALLFLAVRPSQKQVFLPNKANFYSVGTSKTKPIQSQTNPFSGHIKANLNPLNLKMCQ